MKGKKEKYNFKDFFRNAWWALKFNFTISPTYSLISLFVQILFKVSPILNSYVYASLFTKLAQIISDGSSFDRAVQTLAEPLIIIFFMDIFLSLLSILRGNINSRLRRLRRVTTDRRYIDKYISLSIEQLDSPELSNLIKKAEDGFWRLESLYEDLIRYISEFIAGVTSVAILLSFEPIIVLLGFIFTLPLVYKDIKHNGEIKKAEDNFAEGNRKYWHGRWMLINRNSVIEQTVLNTKNKLKDIIFNIREFQNRILIGIDNKYALFDAIARFNQIYSVIGTLLIIKRVLFIKGAIGDITFYTDQLNRINNFFSVLLRDLAYLFDNLRYISDIKSFFELTPSITNGNKKLKISKSPTIEFKDVSFKYPGSQKYVLRNINLVIKPNEEIALVGENGAGKSTLIKLLLRFYKPTRGEILINEIRLQDLDIDTYYNNVSALFQYYDYVGFLSIKENIEFAKTSKSNLSYIKSAKMADIHRSIMKLPNEYETKSYSYFDGGIELSQGQSQKLVIARAFYKNAPILILDEPTASIDAISESKIFDRIYKFMTNKTVIIISHRFSTVRNAKKIYVLQDGKIIESGSHEELIKEQGIYYKSFSLQAEGYTN